MNATRNAPANQVTREPAETYLRKPLYSVSGNADAYDVRVLMPGVAKSGVRVDFEDNVLTVHGQRKLNTPEGWKALHSELAEADFQLRLRLNAPVDEDKMTATMENGVLTLHLPVKETAKPRRIQVQ
ncbi:MAG TPA: Hsp20/alpha crystallin family protein [Prosthecobacter sp.]|nr:Hsp20/alpha crystallin family protein [Prosthecobacter sp.]